MHRYRVVECSADEHRLGLRCSQGSYHEARALNALPPAGAALHGTRPQLGFGILICHATGAIYRVIFDLINAGAPQTGPGPRALAKPKPRAADRGIPGQAD